MIILNGWDRPHPLANPIFGFLLSCKGTQIQIFAHARASEIMVFTRKASTWYCDSNKHFAWILDCSVLRHLCAKAISTVEPWSMVKRSFFSRVNSLPQQASISSSLLLCSSLPKSFYRVLFATRDRCMRYKAENAARRLKIMTVREALQPALHAPENLSIWNHDHITL